MNEQRIHQSFSGTVAKNAINPVLITMQIQALRESLRRIVDQNDGTEIELLSNELKAVESKPNC